MINKEELISYARLKSLNLGQAEKEYFQNVFLFILYQHFGKELVFKGGTALSKAYGLERFSEDLDFTLSSVVDIRPILQKGIDQFYFQADMEEQKFSQSIAFTVRIHGPLYAGSRTSLCKIELDFSLREPVIKEPAIITLGKLSAELPLFDVIVMSKEEILAEKIRAIMTRTKARDVYDLWYLLQHATTADKELINAKLRFCGQTYGFTRFEQHLSLKERIWVSELKPLLSKVPAFRDVRKVVLEKMKKL